MALPAGTRLGPYEIQSPIGAGGMGEVFKARDTRLERTVAIKVLPPALASDPEFKARFEREAKSISALNHPHICTLYDVGRLRAEGASAGQGEQELDFLVMEHLEGETLAARLSRGPMAVSEVIELAGQMADALDKAHRQGIVHRDLKPANVFLVKGAGASGAPVCKLLDFGLAKIGAAVPPGTVETKLLTSPPAGTAQGQPLTAKGSILGTFQYMAPEQIEGQDADARTDIWGFGCVLYEMLTGRRAFEGMSQASLIATILERQPTPMAELQPMTPPALGRVVRTCLEKNPDNRFHTAHDLWLHLQWIEEGGSAAGLPAPVVAGRRRRDRAIFFSAAAGLALLAASAAWFLKPAPEVAHVTARFSYPLPDGQTFTRVGRRIVAVSPDGTKIAYIANNQIYLRRMHELDAQPIRGTDIDPIDLTFSPDGNAIAFFTAGSAAGFENVTLRKIDIAGGKPVTLCAAGVPFGIRWQNGRVVFSLGDRILAVPDTGGPTPETLVTASGTERLARPSFVGDDGTLLYTLRTGTTDQIVLQPVGGGARRVLVADGMDGRITSTGHLIWVRDTTLMAQAFDRRSLQVSGGAVPLVEGVRTAPGAAVAQLSVSDGGTLVFVPGTSETRGDLVWVDRAGREEPTGAPASSYTYPRVSPDGGKVALNTTEGDGDVWIWDVARKTITKLTSGPELDAYSVWTPDSRAVIFRTVASGGGQTDLFRRNADGTGGVERLTETPEAETAFGVTRDSKSVLVRVAKSDVAGEGTLMLFPLAPGSKPEPVLPSTVPPQSNAEISPDGRWIAYQSREGSTSSEIHVRPFPASDSGHWQVTSGGGQRPMWSRSGLELFYVAFNPNRLMRMSVEPSGRGGAFAYGTPATVLDLTKYSMGALGRTFDISPDDKRFLVIKPVGADAFSHLSLTVVTNWFEELKARVKAK